jgi:hypothetical protein
MTWTRRSDEVVACATQVLDLGDGFMGLDTDPTIRSPSLTGSINDASVGRGTREVEDYIDAPAMRKL